MAWLPAASCCLPRRRRSLLAQQLLGRCHDAVGLEAELLLKRLQRRGRAKRPHADDVPGAADADVALPAERGGLFHRHPRLYVWWQHAVTILLRLMLEDLPRRHRDDASADPFREQLAVRFHR